MGLGFERTQNQGLKSPGRWQKPAADRRIAETPLQVAQMGPAAESGIQLGRGGGTGPFAGSGTGCDFLIEVEQRTGNPMDQHAERDH